MPCTPIKDNQVSPPNAPGVSGFANNLPGLNIPFSPIDNVDLNALFNQLGLLLPPGALKANLDPDVVNELYKGVNNILTAFGPFLLLYKFFLPVLNLILCIIEVLCALLNPFKLPGAISKLFRVCLPEFLSLFPFFALVIMVISLLLLMVALIEYLVARIIQIMEIIIANIISLGRAAQRLEEDGIIAILTKIGDLLCFLQNLFVILGVILIIVEVIKSILSLGFSIPPCDSSDGSSTGCCTADVCPSFIKNNSIITSNTGNFLYYNQVGINSGLSLPAGFPPIVSTVRNESWQFYDPNLGQSQAFINISKAFDLPAGVKKVFFPAGTNYTVSTEPSSTPYTINFRFFYDPSAFNIIDPKGARFLNAVNVIIKDPPTAGVAAYDGTSTVAPTNGTLNLIGGVMEEDDGTPILDAHNNTIPLNTFIHNAVDISGIPSNNGILFSNITYEFTINHEILLGESLITLGCIPEVAADRDFINTTIGAQFNLNGIKLNSIALPDVAGTQACITAAITEFRSNISVDSANAFQSNIIACLGDLQNQTTSALTSAINAGTDQYKSDFSISPSIQFTTAPIVVSVSLMESSGQLITANLPSATASQIAESITGTITLGNITQFSYDGYGLFTANITSNTAGNGSIKVMIDNNYISVLNNPADITQTPSVAIQELNYTFVQSSAFTTSSSTNDGEPRRDNSDVSREGS